MSQASMDQQKEMFGCPQSALDDAIKNQMLPGDFGTLMLAMSLLSDAQEVLSMGNREKCRQTINQAKYIISAVMKNVHKQ